MKYKLSKAVKSGQIVSLRGDKFIRCSRLAKPAGGYTNGLYRKTLLLSGETVETIVPSGMVVWGEFQILPVPG